MNNVNRVNKEEGVNKEQGISREQAIKNIFYELGSDVCGIGDISRFGGVPKGFSPLDVYPECKSVISFGVALPKGIFEVPSRLIYSHFNGSVMCGEVDRIAFYASTIIERRFDCKVVPIPCDAPNEYWEAETLTAKGIISMKHTAVACGLGQLGKSTLLINPVYGNRLTIGAILTNMELKSDEYCESVCIPGCRKCQDACPVSAIADGHVNQKLCRLNTYGKTARGFDTVDCNKCREVCPMR